MSNLKKLKGQLKSKKDEIHKIRKARRKIAGLLRKEDITDEEKSELKSTEDKLYSRAKDLEFDLLSIEYYMLCLVPSSYIPKKNIRAVHGVNGDNYIHVRSKEIIKEAGSVNYFDQLLAASTYIRYHDDNFDVRYFREPTDDVIISDELVMIGTGTKYRDIDTKYVHKRLLGNAEEKFKVSTRPKENEAKLII